MKCLSEEQYQDIIRDGKVLEKDANGAKVIALSNGRYFKAFYHKSRISSSRLFSRASRFAKNAYGLSKLGINSIKPEQTFKLKNPARDCVVYQGVPGITLRQALQTAPQNPTLCAQLGAYLAHLHQQGVIFRSVHLGNIILQPDGELALIDISDMALNKWPLVKWQRKRNFSHLLRYGSDQNLLNFEALSAAYCQQCRKFSQHELIALISKTKNKHPSK